MERLSSTLESVLRTINPPIRQSNAINQSINQSISQSSPIKNDNESPVKIRWPNDSSVKSINQSLLVHDLTVIAINAIILQILRPMDLDSNADHFLPNDWNTNRLMYSFTYSINQSINQSVNQSENAENERYRLIMKAVPLNEFLILTMQIHTDTINQSVNQSINQNDASNQSINHSIDQSDVVKMTIKCSNFVDTDKLSELLSQSSQLIDQSTDRSTNQSIDQSVNQSIDQSIDQSINQPLTVDVYRNLDKLMSVVSNGLIKRSMGALWSVLINQSINQSESFGLSDLPIDILISILLSINSRELVRLSQVSRALYDLSSLETLWQMLCMTELKATRERQSINPSNWKNEFIIRKQLMKDEQERNKYALVPIGQPISVEREQVFQRPVFRAPFINQSINDPLGLTDWRRGGFR